MIEKHSLKILEYDKIVEKLAGLTLTEGGRRLSLDLQPQSILEEVEHSQNNTAEFVDYLLIHPELPIGGARDLSPLLKKSSNEMIPEISELIDLIYFLEIIDRLKKIPKDLENSEKYQFVNKINYLEDLPFLLKRLKECIHNDDIADRASPELYSIRREIRRSQDNIKTHLNRILSSKTTALQEAIITIRDGRYVVPVKSEKRSEIPGIVHDMSGSGATVFIEPISVVELNNKIRELELAEKNEIYKILLELTKRIKEVIPHLKYNADIIADLDFNQAKAKLAFKMKAVKPILNDQGRIILHDARHPLIPEDEVVPIYFELGTDFDTLIITGPNTGGKTVSLKTCGLFVLMAMAGLHIPAKTNSEVAVFEKVLADIGDEQSIEQNLSTFSSHLKQIIDILDKANHKTLVLTDELGAGTDPSEGAALAIAILDYLRQKGAYTVATTHYRELKGYALNTNKVKNACCEFDEENLKPTYKLLIGVPGVSNAFKISQRLGLKDEIIRHAENLISDENTKFEELVNAIEKSHQQAQAMTDEITMLKRESARLQKQLEAEKETFEISRQKLIVKARDEAEKIISSTQEEVSEILDNLKQEIKEAQTSSQKQEAQKEAREASRKLFEKAKDNRNKKSKMNVSGYQGESIGIEDIELGNQYHSNLYNIDGQVIDILKKEKQVVLKSGVLTVNVPVHSLQPLKQDRQEKQISKSLVKEKKSAQKIIRERKYSSVSEIKLLGMTVSEALYQLDNFVDDAVLANLPRIRIVHGKGTGALREAVHENLRQDKRIKSFQLAALGEGDSGVTIAEL